MLCTVSVHIAILVLLDFYATENFNPEDVAIAWVNTYARDVSQSLILWCRVTGLRRIFICGGFCSNALVRRCLTKELVGRTYLLDLQNPQKVLLISSITTYLLMRMVKLVKGKVTASFLKVILRGGAHFLVDGP